MLLLTLTITIVTITIEVGVEDTVLHLVGPLRTNTCIIKMALKIFGFFIQVFPCLRIRIVTMEGLFSVLRILNKKGISFILMVHKPAMSILMAD